MSSESVSSSSSSSSVFSSLDELLARPEDSTVADVAAPVLRAATDQRAALSRKRTHKEMGGEEPASPLQSKKVKVSPEPLVLDKTLVAEEESEDSDSSDVSMSTAPEVSQYLAESGQSLGRMIGKGNCGEVFALRSKKPVKEQDVIKIIRMKRSFFSSQDPFAGELLSLSLHHPNVLSSKKVIMGNCRGKETIQAIVMPRVAKSQDLKEWMARSAPSWSQIHYVAKQVVGGVVYLNAEQVAHRDLKPENILLDEFLNVKIIDFGIARKMRPMDRTYSVKGTLLYFSPERLAQKDYTLEQADAWSLGVILYELAFKKHPFPNMDFNLTFSEDPTVPANYVNVVKGLLEIDPAKRLSAKAALAML